MGEKSPPGFCVDKVGDFYFVEGIETLLLTDFDPSNALLTPFLFSTFLCGDQPTFINFKLQLLSIFCTENRNHSRQELGLHLIKEFARIVQEQQQKEEKGLISKDFFNVKKSFQVPLMCLLYGLVLCDPSLYEILTKLELPLPKSYHPLEDEKERIIVNRLWWCTQSIELFPEPLKEVLTEALSLSLSIRHSLHHNFCWENDICSPECLDEKYLKDFLSYRQFLLYTLGKVIVLFFLQV